MKKLILMLFCICLIGFSTDALAQVSKTEPAKNNSTSKTPSTQKPADNKTYTNPQADRQNKKGDAQLNKANSSYQKAQNIQRNTNTTQTSRPTNNNDAAKDNRPTSKPTTNSATTNKTPNTKPTTATNQTGKRPTTTNNNNSASDNKPTTKPTTRPTTTSKTPATPSTETSKTPTDRTTETDNTAKRGYNDKGEAKPQLAPTARTNKPDNKNNNDSNIGDEKHGYYHNPYVHPNSHGFGNHYTHIPSHARPVYYNNRPYYFYNSRFCRYLDGRYIICRPPIGAVIAYNLFHTWHPIIIIYQNVNYYYDDGTFYKPYNSHNQHGYQVVAPPIGARIAELPSTYEYLNLDGRAYFKVDNVYFKEIIVGGYIWYEVVWVGKD